MKRKQVMLTETEINGLMELIALLKANKRSVLYQELELHLTSSGWTGAARALAPLRAALKADRY